MTKQKGHLTFLQLLCVTLLKSSKTTSEWFWKLVSVFWDDHFAVFSGHFVSRHQSATALSDTCVLEA